MKCPHCKRTLLYNSLDTTVSTMEKRYYNCINCNRQFERIIGRNALGLVKHDTIYEVDSLGNYLDKWD